MKLTQRQIAGVVICLVAILLISVALWTAHRRLTDSNQLRGLYGYMMLMIQVCFAATVGSVWLLWLAITRVRWRLVLLLMIVILLPASWWGFNLLAIWTLNFSGPHAWGRIFQWISGYGFGLLVAAAWVFFGKPREAS